MSISSNGLRCMASSGGEVRRLLPRKLMGSGGSGERANDQPANRRKRGEVLSSAAPGRVVRIVNHPLGAGSIFCSHQIFHALSGPGWQRLLGVPALDERWDKLVTSERKIPYKIAVWATRPIAWLP